MSLPEEFNENEGIPVQIVVELDADHATYFYKQQRWEAHAVLIQRYQLPGRKLPEKIEQEPFFSGTAREIAFDMKSQPPALHTYGLNASLIKEGA